ncbi:hypothetical protein D039_2737A, partial [Vibrio parahaemolyticus EKP-028]
MFDTEIG